MYTVNEANLDLLLQMTHESYGDYEHRFVVWGSLGRAALLGNALTTLKGDSPRRFQDVDAIDQAGELSGKYTFTTGATLDTGSTPIIKPVDKAGKVWGAYDTLTSINDRQPIVTFSRESLGLHKIKTNDEHAVSLTTPDACGHLGILDICQTAIGPMAKHQEQISALKSRQDELCVDCDRSELQQATQAYTAIMATRLATATLPSYTRFRRKIFRTAPHLAERTMESRVGSMIRAVRGSNQPVTQLSNLNELLASQRSSLV